jgi:predicted nucleotide-binding protein (sugar kinase/HSP70/actin superfamily)
MAISYDVMMNEISNTVNSGKPYSLSDIALNTINAIGKIVKERRNNVGN